MTLSRLPARCKQCSVRFTPEERAKGKRLHDDCTGLWADAYASKAERARVRKAAKAERESDKARREKLDGIPQLKAKADKAFADFIRTRDRLAGHPCISSGKPLDWSGNKVDAGHYRSRGAASHIRYDERNCHAQTKYENRHRAGNVVEYRIRLIARIGLAAVEALEAENAIRKWTADELRQIAVTYRAKRKELEKERA